MAPKRGLFVVKIRNLVRVMSEPQPSTSGFTVITPGEKLLDVFMDGDLSSNYLPPSPHPSPLLFYIIHHQPSIMV
ncbi:hypothetical protein E2C01_076494 [Portunus trituberculatus]|uniref:Uncharacterized protein n=1 Tax=Portunus trituberculatus TaxID=210409 RepID=A0A5B7IIP5_PORTR|nr:hypothetical protein [Portunus trituberculatus]